MTIENNLKAYRLIMEMEVALREFLIQLINKYGIENWFHDFLGSIQRETINEVIKRVSTTNDSTFEEIFLVKTIKAHSELNKLGITILYHPFYYLNWPDLESLINMKQNSKIIEKVIEKNNIDILTSNLRSINNLRNDIAHSRYISNNECKHIENCHNSISNLIPDFTKYLNIISYENVISIQFTNMRVLLTKIISVATLSNEEVNDLQATIFDLKRSFWLAIVYPSFITQLKVIDKLITEYYKIRNQPGGLLAILNWKKQNLNTIENIIRTF